MHYMFRSTFPSAAFSAAVGYVPKDCPNQSSASRPSIRRSLFIAVERGNWLIVMVRIVKPRNLLHDPSLYSHTVPDETHSLIYAENPDLPSQSRIAGPTFNILMISARSLVYIRQF
jgi:hypothetical protein